MKKLPARALAVIVLVFAVSIPSGVVGATAGDPPAGQGGDATAADAITSPWAEMDAAQPTTLTLADAIRMALVNNLDLRVASYDPRIEAENIERALSVFDPTVSANAGYSLDRQLTLASPSGALISKDLENYSYQLTIQERTLSGATISIQTSSSKGITNSPAISLVSPFYLNRISFALSQPLLRNAGVDVNRTQILITQNNFRTGVFNFEEDVMDVVLSVINAYWNLVFARDDLTAKDKSLQAAEDFLKNIEIKVLHGALPELEVARAKARVAERTEEIVRASAIIKDVEDSLRRLLGSKTLPLLSIAEIVPVDPPQVHVRQLDLADAVNYALAARPALAALKMAMESNDIIVARDKNQLLPQVDLTATITLNGLADDYNDSWDNLATLNDTDFGTRLTFLVPLGNRSARASYTQARYRRLKVLARYALTERDITLAVKKALRDIRTSIQSVETNQLRVDANREQLRAEQNRYAVGQNISLDVLDAQEALQRAESALIASIVRFNQAMANYYRQTGLLLQHHGITVRPPAVID